jgi:hypothetical protein
VTLVINILKRYLWKWAHHVAQDAFVATVARCSTMGRAKSARGLRPMRVALRLRKAQRRAVQLAV